MENVIELLDQEKYKEVHDYLDDKIKNNPFLLETLFEIEVTRELDEEDKKIIDIVNEISNSEHNWLVEMICQNVFYYIREKKEFDQLIRKIKEKYSVIHKSKKIDLKENEWAKIELTHSERELPNATLSLSFDEEFFKIKAEVHDNHFLDGNRAWRYGDGFYMNFLLPEGKEIEECIDTQRFYSLGFSREEGKPIGVLVNYSGTYYLRTIDELEPEIFIDEEKKTANYNIRIPFTFLKPFNPLVDEISGFFIRYISQDNKKSRTSIKIIEDQHADSEMTNYRRFVPVSYTFAQDSPLKIAGILDNRLAQADVIILNLHIFSPKKFKDNLEIQILDSKKEIISRFSKKIDIQKGKQIISEDIDVKKFDTSLYSINIKIKDVMWNQTIFKFNLEEIKELDDEIKSLKKLESTQLLENSIYTLEYKLHEMNESIQNFHYRDDPTKLDQELKDIKQLIDNCKKNKSLFIHSGYLQSAFRSKDDNSLQPYSIVLPEEFDPNREYYLFVGLHGSGVDEVGFIRFMGKNLQELGVFNTIIIGPRGRNLSDYYVGQSEEDVVDLIDKIKSIFKIKKTIIFGFSMGGYGCWRLSLKHPELFESAIIAAGMPYFDGKKENDMRNFIDKPNKIDYLVIHSDDDRSVTIEKTDEFIEELKKNGFSIVYERLTGVDHGNMDIGEIVGKWLKNYLV
ncbi:MAG: alpha/beta fold hydrolase [Candidatus Heimdallarchaeota archaeon]|nr:alpha/beta fold hydrolase [Candidatus Heimdallarchaeota archaeon]